MAPTDPKTLKDFGFSPGHNVSNNPGRKLPYKAMFGPAHCPMCGRRVEITDERTVEDGGLDDGVEFTGICPEHGERRFKSFDYADLADLMRATEGQ
jgi:hypothetical protein